MTQNEQKSTLFESGYTYIATHIPTGEKWCILGIDVKGNRVCAAGYPPTIAKLHDCEHFHKSTPLDETELSYRINKFGTNWL